MTLGTTTQGDHGRHTVTNGRGGFLTLRVLSRAFNMLWSQHGDTCRLALGVLPFEVGRLMSTARPCSLAVRTGGPGHL